MKHNRTDVCRDMIFFIVVINVYKRFLKYIFSIKTRFNIFFIFPMFFYWQRLWLRLGVNVDDQLWLRLNPIPNPSANPSPSPSPNPDPNRPTYL